MTKTTSQHNGFEKFASGVCKVTRSTPAFIIVLCIVLVWGIKGPFFGYSQTCQLIINTGTTIITFLIVFLIQKAQNKDYLAIQLKVKIERLRREEYYKMLLKSAHRMLPKIKKQVQR